MGITNKQVFELQNGQFMTLSVLDGDLLMLHGNFISAQMPLEGLGVKVFDQGPNIKVQFFLDDRSSYGFYFRSNQFSGLSDYFRQLRYPERCFIPALSQD